MSSWIRRSRKRAELKPTIENGFVHLPETAHWLADYLHELTMFPAGRKLVVFGTNRTRVELPDYPWTATRLFKAEPALRALGRTLASRRDLPLAEIVAIALSEYAQLISGVDTVN